YPVTPATSFSIGKDLGGSDKQTVWFDSRFYRVNLFWEEGSFRIRDIHLFDERLSSEYETQPATSNECSFFTLPFVDGYLWSKPGRLAGLRLKAKIGGAEVAVEGGKAKFFKKGESLRVSWPLRNVRGSFEVELGERGMKMWMTGAGDWFLDFTTAENVPLPIEKVSGKMIESRFEKVRYSVKAEKGSFSQPGGGVVWRIRPEGNVVQLKLGE
ncbi:MAG: hypothetical protein JST68_10520, partial [Bacteroidetes bacterium]|nr:hypothetical protein [Bacteroidota bacterium]